MSDIALLVSVTGRVQGVGFRIWTMDRAGELHLRGWVRNEPDGSVSALVGGPEESVAKMLDLFWSGPRGAAVTGVTSRPADPADLPSGFGHLR